MCDGKNEMIVVCSLLKREAWAVSGGLTWPLLHVHPIVAWVVYDTELGQT